MRALALLVLLSGCKMVQPYGEKACTAAGWIPEPPASAPVETAEEHEDEKEAALTNDVDSRLALLAGKVRSKRKELETKETDLKAREDKLAADIKRFEEQQEKVAEEKKAAAERAVAAKKPKETVSQVQTTIALMPPKNAAKVLEAMDDKQAASVFSKLPPERAAEIFNAMTPPRAARISAVLDSEVKPRRGK